jgi:hypothetical protein
LRRVRSGLSSRCRLLGLVSALLRGLRGARRRLCGRKRLIGRGLRHLYFGFRRAARDQRCGGGDRQQQGTPATHITLLLKIQSPQSSASGADIRIPGSKRLRKFTLTELVSAVLRLSPPELPRVVNSNN